MAHPLPALLPAGRVESVPPGRFSGGMPSRLFTPRDTVCEQTVPRGFRFPVRLRGALMVSSQTVLVVEDNDEAREGLAVLLRREGYEVLLAEHGEEALGHLRAGPRPALVLLDMLMPVLDGWHFLARLCQNESPVPVVIMTG